MNPTTPQTPAQQPAPVPQPASQPVSQPASQPIPRPAQPPTPTASQSATLPAGQAYKPPVQPKKILMVEDDDDLAKVYTMRFRQEGFDIRRVNNGEDALAAATEYRPDLILLDVMMPKISGFDVLDILRNTPETANMKVVILTALGQDSDRKRAESLAVNGYLVKSEVVLDDIVSNIKQVIAAN